MKTRPPIVRLLSFSALSLSLLILASCDPFNTRNEPPIKTQGYAPIYDSSSTAKEVTISGPEAIVNGGKIYTKGDFLYQVETGRGIHVINIADPRNPEKLKFIHVTGAQEMAIYDQYLYTNNINDMVILDISDFNNPTESGRIKNSFHLVDQSYPPAGGYYVCPDASRGEVIGWKLTTIYRPQCQL